MKKDNTLSLSRWMRYSMVLSMLTAIHLPSMGATSQSAMPSVLDQVAPTKLRGHVVDARTGEPLIGVNIQVKGQKNLGAVTNLNGDYVLEAREGVMLRVSYIGYEVLEVKAEGGNQVIRLTESKSELSTVIVVGYTTQRKESLTGAMVSLTDSKLKDMTTPSVSNLLNGKAPGVYVAPGSGRPGSTAAVVIRGQATLNGNTRPLWVIGCNSWRLTRRAQYAGYRKYLYSQRCSIYRHIWLCWC